MEYVCALRVEYSDGTSTHRVIHRGPEEECDVVAGLVPASRIEPDLSKLPREVRELARSAPLERIEVTDVPGKVALAAHVVVVREDRLYL